MVTKKVDRKIDPNEVDEMELQIEDLIVGIGGEGFVFMISERKNGSKIIEVRDIHENSVANEKKTFEVDCKRRGIVHYDSSDGHRIDRKIRIPITGSPDDYVSVHYDTFLKDDRENGYFTVFDNKTKYLIYRRHLVDINHVMIQKLFDMVEKRVVPNHCFMMGVPKSIF